MNGFEIVFLAILALAHGIREVWHRKPIPPNQQPYGRRQKPLDKRN